MLNSGEVPNLFEKDELEQVLAAIRPKAKDAGICEENRDEVITETSPYSIKISYHNQASKVFIIEIICASEQIEFVRHVYTASDKTDLILEILQSCRKSDQYDKHFCSKMGCWKRGIKEHGKRLWEECGPINL